MGSYSVMVSFLCSSPFLNDFLKTALGFSTSQPRSIAFPEGQDGASRLMGLSLLIAGVRSAPARCSPGHISPGQRQGLLSAHSIVVNWP